MLMFQVFVNVGMTIGIMPITGVTLPLMSYGGSSVPDHVPRARPAAVDPRPGAGSRRARRAERSSSHEKATQCEKASAGQRRPRGDARRAAGGDRQVAAATSHPADAAARRPANPAAGYRVAELYIERRGGRSIVGNIYKGKVDNVLPGLEAAFVDIGLEKNGFLHVDEIVLPGVETPKRGRGSRRRAQDRRPAQDPARRSSCRSSRTR